MTHEASDHTAVETLLTTDSSRETKLTVGYRCENKVRYIKSEKSDNKIIVAIKASSIIEIKE